MTEQFFSVNLHCAGAKKRPQHLIAVADFDISFWGI